MLCILKIGGGGLDPWQYVQDTISSLDPTCRACTCCCCCLHCMLCWSTAPLGANCANCAPWCVSHNVHMVAVLQGGCIHIDTSRETTHRQGPDCVHLTSGGLCYPWCTCVNWPWWLNVTATTAATCRTRSQTGSSVRHCRLCARSAHPSMVSVASPLSKCTTAAMLKQVFLAPKAC